MTYGVGAFSEAPYSADRTLAGSSDTALTPGVVALTLTGYAPTVSQTANVTLTPGVVALTLTGYAPTVTQTTGLNLVPNPASLVLTGYSPTVTQTVTFEFIPGVLGLSLVGYAPTVTQTGIVTPTKGGKGQGSNLTLKQKKKLKAVVNQEWLKAEQTVQELLLERLGHTEPAKVRVEKLTQSQSLLDVIDALKALSKETVTLPEQQAVIKTINKTITEKTIKQVDRTEELEKRMAAFEKRLVDIEEMVLVALSEIL